MNRANNSAPVALVYPAVLAGADEAAAHLELPDGELRFPADLLDRISGDDTTTHDNAPRLRLVPAEVSHV